jgi:hypothetical protein
MTGPGWNAVGEREEHTIPVFHPAQGCAQAGLLESLREGSSCADFSTEGPVGSESAGGRSGPGGLGSWRWVEM